MDSPVNGIQVIARAAAILRACAQDGAGQSLGEIALAVKLPRSTVQRIVAALAAEGLLLAGGDTRSIRLGPQVHALAGADRIDVVERAHPFLKRLSGQTGETVDLAILSGDHMVFIDQIAAGQRLRAVSAVGETFPLHCTANGKAALASLDDAELNAILQLGLEPHTPATITDPQVLRTELQAIRKTGIAIDREEHSPGICAVGAAFRDPASAIYAVSIPMPSVRFEGAGEVFRDELLATINDITQALQWRQP